MYFLPVQGIPKDCRNLFLTSLLNWPKDKLPHLSCWREIRKALPVIPWVCLGPEQGS